MDKSKFKSLSPCPSFVPQNSVISVTINKMLNYLQIPLEMNKLAQVSAWEERLPPGKIWGAGKGWPAGQDQGAGELSQLPDLAGSRECAFHTVKVFEIPEH